MRDCTEVDSWTPYLVNTELERRQELRLDKKKLFNQSALFFLEKLEGYKLYGLVKAEIEVQASTNTKSNFFIF